MQDGIIKGTGNSRYLKGAGWPATYEEFKTMAEAGTLPIDLAGINAEGWQQIGMAFAKATMLSDATAAKYFASPVGTETVDQILSLLGRFQGGLGNEYVWEKSKNERTFGALQSTDICSGSSSAYWGTIYYADSINDDGTLISPLSIHVDNSTQVSNTNVVKGKYWSFTAYNATALATGTYYTPSDAANAVSTYTTVYTLSIYAQKYNGVAKVVYGYVNSPDSDAYPPTESDGYTYTALGQVGNKVQISTGSYTGTGTYGIANPISIPLGINAKFAIITAMVANSTSYINSETLFINVELFKSLVAGSTVGFYQGFLPGSTTIPSVYRGASDTLSNDSVQICATNSTAYFNRTGVTYRVFAIGGAE